MPAIFENDINGAVNAMYRLIGALTVQVAWLWVALFHAFLLFACALAMWLSQVTPTTASDAIQQAARSTPFAVLSVAGVSALTLLAAYWWLAKAMQRFAQRRLAAFLTSPLAMP